MMKQLKETFILQSGSWPAMDLVQYQRLSNLNCEPRVNQHQDTQTARNSDWY